MLSWFGFEGVCLLPVRFSSGRVWFWWSPSEMERGLLLGGLEIKRGRERLLGRWVILVLLWRLKIWVWGIFFCFVLSDVHMSWDLIQKLDTGSGDNGFTITFFFCVSLLVSSCHSHSFLFSQWWPQLRSCAGDPAAAHKEGATRLDNRSTFLSYKTQKKETEGKEKHQRKQMRPCTAWRTSSSLMDTSCPSIPPPPPPLPQLPRPHPARLPRPHRRPTANTMKSWRTGQAPEQWMAMREGLGYPMGTVVEPDNPKHIALAVPTTTTNPETGIYPGGRGRTAAKLTPTPWEIRWPQTVGKTYSVLHLVTSDVLLPD